MAVYCEPGGAQFLHSVRKGHKDYLESVCEEALLKRKGLRAILRRLCGRRIWAAEVKEGTWELSPAGGGRGSESMKKLFTIERGRPLRRRPVVVRR